MFQKIAKHRANDASNDVHRPPLRLPGFNFIARKAHPPPFNVATASSALCAFCKVR